VDDVVVKTRNSSTLIDDLEETLKDRYGEPERGE
jgi:hypothetical protein